MKNYKKNYLINKILKYRYIVSICIIFLTSNKMFKTYVNLQETTHNFLEIFLGISNDFMNKFSMIHFIIFNISILLLSLYEVSKKFILGRDMYVIRKNKKNIVNELVSNIFLIVFFISLITFIFYLINMNIYNFKMSNIIHDVIYFIMYTMFKYVLVLAIIILFLSIKKYFIISLIVYGIINILFANLKLNFYFICIAILLFLIEYRVIYKKILNIYELR